MSNLITDSRLAFMKAIKDNLTANGGPFEVIAGTRDGVSRDRNLACVFAPPMKTDGANVNFSNPQLVVRAWVRQPKTPKASSPQDPAPVEQLMIDLADVIAAVTAPEGVYWIVQEIAPDYVDWGVQVQLLGWTVSPAANVIQ